MGGIKRGMTAVLVWIFLAATAAYAEQFPFFAQTDELAVNLRPKMSTSGKAVGQIARGEFVTVLAACESKAGETWYVVQLEDETLGYIRSDLLQPLQEMPTELAAVGKTATSEQKDAYIGNRKTKKFHLPTCRSLPKESNRVYFDTRDEAINEGYDPCMNCHP